MEIKPHSKIIPYNGYRISVVYDPVDKCWRWRAHKTVTQLVEFTGTAMEMNSAVRSAKRKVDKVEEVE